MQDYAFRNDWIFFLWANNTLSSAGQRYDGGVKPKFNVNQVAITQVKFEGTESVKFFHSMLRSFNLHY